ncbi:MAG: cytochrome c biogenesis protein CcsA, partial [Planctomycetota bacterium]|nr:cytochrome c biogenesis protein CcsA [Planctomycetota bacterium]
SACVAIGSFRVPGLRGGPWLHLAVIAAAIFHSAGIGVHCAHSSTHFFTSHAENLWLLSWTLGIGYLALLLGFRMRTLGALTLPLSSAMLFVSRFVTQPGLPPTAAAAQHPLLPVHIMCAFLGYGLFLTACAASVLYLEEHRLLKRKIFGVLFHGLPSLEKLEKAATLCTWAGFGLFTVALGTGAFLAKHYGGGEAWYLEPKILATQATWLVFLVLLVGRLSGRLIGRASAKTVLVGAALVVGTFLLAHPFREQPAPAATHAEPAATEARPAPEHGERRSGARAGRRAAA